MQEDDENMIPDAPHRPRYRDHTNMNRTCIPHRVPSHIKISVP